MAVDCYQKIQLKMLEQGRYAVTEIFQVGRQEILDKIFRFKNELSVKEHRLRDISGYHSYEFMNPSLGSKFPSIVFQIPIGYQTVGIVKSDGIKDAILFQTFCNSQGMEIEAFVFKNEVARSLLYLEMMEEGYLDEPIGMIQSECKNHYSCGAE